MHERCQSLAFCSRGWRQEPLALFLVGGQYQGRQSQSSPEDGQGGTWLHSIKFLDDNGGIQHGGRCSTVGNRDLTFDEA
jgi:hypothetical protein